MVSEMNYKSDDADCVLLLLCKLKPFIWSMQKVVNEKIVGAESQPSDKKSSEKNSMDAFFRFVPSREEFSSNGVDCEDTYTACKLY